MCSNRTGFELVISLTQVGGDLPSAVVRFGDGDMSGNKHNMNCFCYNCNDVCCLSTGLSPSDKDNGKQTRTGMDK